MKEQIIEKLDIFLQRHKTFKEEHEVVYLMVELRKLLDHMRDRKNTDPFSLVRFHADWVVHTKKEHITPAIREIMERIDKSIDTYPKDDNINFLLLPEFRKELTELLNEFGLPSEFCKDELQWFGFMVTLTQVLADQPILNPTDNIAEFCYIDMKGEGLMANIDFRGVRSGESITLGFGL